MKTEKPPPNVDDIELHPDAWERFVRAVKQMARHSPVRHPTDRSKQPSKPKKSPATRRP